MSECALYGGQCGQNLKPFFPSLPQEKKAVTIFYLFASLSPRPVAPNPRSRKARHDLKGKVFLVVLQRFGAETLLYPILDLARRAVGHREKSRRIFCSFARKDRHTFFVRKKKGEKFCSAFFFFFFLHLGNTRENSKQGEGEKKIRAWKK